MKCDVSNPFFCENCSWKTVSLNWYRSQRLHSPTETAASLQQVALLWSLATHTAASYSTQYPKQSARSWIPLALQRQDFATLGTACFPGELKSKFIELKKKKKSSLLKKKTKTKNQQTKNLSWCCSTPVLWWSSTLHSKELTSIASREDLAGSLTASFRPLW